jgi:hypothetical protein
MTTRTVAPTYNGVTSNPKTLGWVVPELINDAAALANEMRTDHGTFKVTVDQLETLAEELGADHATFKTAVDATNVWTTEVDADLDEINDYLDSLNEPDGVIGGDFTIAAQADPNILGAGRVRYRIGGVEYESVMETAVVLEDSGDITQSTFGAWSVLIDKLGVVTTEDTGAQMAFATAEDALLNLASRADSTGKACLGYVTVTDSGGAFNIGTTNTSGGTATTAVYMNRGPVKRFTGLTAALGAATAVGSTPENYSTGTRDYCINGLNKAQDAAEADKTFDDADTIGQSQFGGHLIVTNLAQNATYALASDGVAGSVSAMTHASSAAADTALDTLVDRLPSLFCPVAKLVVENNLGGAFTYGTDDINSTDGTATFTDCTAGTWDRTVSTGFDSHQRDVPAIPATVTAPIPAAGPDTLGASTAITSGPLGLSAAAVDDISLRPGGAP